ncbi:MAG TPA: TetR/AcrR family transcriptional regulator [Acidimicrobiales bacterium]|jgi:AcrR family transcriptional regulator
MVAADSKRRRTSRARRRLLDTATRLFYAEGVHAVGIDRIIAEAQVAKATFYNHFESKDELVRAYIEEQDQLGRAAVAQLPEQPPRERLFALFDRYGEAARQPGYRGCPFLNAAAEYPDPASPVRQAIADHRRWNRDLLRDLLAADGHPEPARTADILIVLGDGLLVSGELDDPKAVPAVTRDAVRRVLDAPRPT